MEKILTAGYKQIKMPLAFLNIGSWYPEPSFVIEFIVFEGKSIPSS